MPVEHLQPVSSSIARRVVGGAVRTVLKPMLRPAVPVAVQRRWAMAATATLLKPRGVHTELHQLDGLALRCARPDAADDTRAVLFLHGGAYLIGGGNTYSALNAWLAHKAGCRAWMPDYRLAPEHPYPAALEDALAAYRYLLDSGIDASRIVLVGDSAGGHLAVITALATLAHDLPMPGGLALISPLTDQTLSGETLITHLQRDPMLREDWMRAAADAFCGETPRDDPRLTPLFADPSDLAQLPPILIQVGSEEVLLSDSLRLTERVEAAGGLVRCEVCEGLWHDFQIHVGMLADSGLALDRLGAFIRRRTGDGAAAGEGATG